MQIKHRYLYHILTAVIASFVVFAFYQHFTLKSMEIKIENNYNRAFHELVNYVDDIDTLLEKSMLVSSATQMSTISSELFRQSSAAKACLGQLPISEVQLESTEKFLSQIGDFTYVLSQSVINDNNVSPQEYQTLLSLSKYAKGLNDGLLAMQQDIYDGNISFGTVGKKSREYFNNSAMAANGDVLSGFEEVEQEFQDYPSLIYDGPFSEHLENLEATMLKGLNDVTSEEGLNHAKNFLSDKGQNLQFSGESRNTSLDSYSYSSSDGEREIFISVTKKGGIPLYFLDTRTVNEEKLTINEAIKKARDFLYSKGYTSLKESYYDKTASIATVNFAYEQSGIICYSDLIKVKVALDNGEIVGYEAHGYIMNHKHRNFPEIKISEDDARTHINTHLSIDTVNMALIPKDSNREVLCYEFKGNHNGKNFLIYINVENGYEEQILMLIESENGVLTM